MELSEKANLIYESNQKLGYRINYLNDQNNFYRISINNIKKLNHSINKNLLTANHKLVSSKNTSPSNIDPKTITEPYTLINNKIQLKNLQMKVGNSKRRVQKLRKLYQGSLSSLLKKAEGLQDDINKLAREYEYYTIQNQLLINIFMADYYQTLLKSPQSKNSSKSTSKQKRFESRSQFRLSSYHLTSKSGSNQIAIRVDDEMRAQKIKNLTIQRLARMGNNKQKILLLQQQQIKCANKLQQLLKQQKSIKNQSAELLEKIGYLNGERKKLSLLVYTSSGNQLNLREAQAEEVAKLKYYNRQEQEFYEEIGKQDSLLQQQYKINQEYKQKILDRNEQQIKEIKVLQQQIKKCGEQVKQVKAKCQNLQSNKNKRITKAK